MTIASKRIVIPAKAGTQILYLGWVPAFAGMTSEGVR